MRTTVSKSSRDTGFTTLAGAVGALVGLEFGRTPEEAALLGTVATALTGAFLSFGWRLCRHYMPWIDGD